MLPPKLPCGLPALCEADCRWHRGRTTWNSLYDKASTLRTSGPVVTLKRLPYPGTPLTVGSSGSAVLYYSLLLQRIAYYLPVWRSRPSPTSTPTRLRRHPQRTGAAGPARDRHCGCRHMDSCGSAEPAARRRNAQPRPQHRAWPGLPGPGHRRGQRGAGRGAGGDMAERAFLPVLHRGYVTENRRFGPEETAPSGWHSSGPGCW